MKQKRQDLWGGRFAAETDARLRVFNDSFSFDWRLLDKDIKGSIAWASSLREAGVLTSREEKRMITGLRSIVRDAKIHGSLPFGEHEDVHSYVESRLADEVGDLARKLHTGRSRNDQVATDLRLWLRDATAGTVGHVLELANALVTRAGQEASTPMPGYTHLKRAEPVTLGHWCLAWVEMLLRDVDRFVSATSRANECPLGSGALAGAPLAIDRSDLAKRLGFDRPTANSIDAVSDRDFVADYLFASSLLFVHLSRLAEDLIFFCSDEVGWIDLPDSLATGSSRMPQKKNPDILELTRGHAGRVIGELAGILSLMKGLPLAYDKDLQLDKEPLFRTVDTLQSCLPLLASLVEGLSIDRAKMLLATSGDDLLATALTDALVDRGIPFRQAHEIVSSRIGEAARKGVSLSELGSNSEITVEDLKSLSVARTLEKKNVVGGTSPRRVKRAATAARRRIRALENRFAKGVRN